MRFRGGFLFLLAILGAGHASAYDVLATVFQFAPPGVNDPDPGIEGVVRIDTFTGAVTPFFTQASNTIQLTDVAVSPVDNTVYVSSLTGTIERYSASGDSLGVFESFTTTVEGEVVADSVNRLLFAPDGALYAGTGSGVIAEFNPAGVRQADRATGVGFVSGLTLSPGGDLYVATGEYFSPGFVSKVDSGGSLDAIFGGVIGGASSITYLPAIGDYDANDETDAADHAAWTAAYGSSDSLADGNGDGSVDAADYTVWRDNLGDHAQILVADNAPGVIPGQPGNRIYAHDLVNDAGSTLATIPLAIPNPLPTPFSVPSNSPSEVLLSPDGTLLVSTSGHSQRPVNSSALLEFGRDGTFIRRIDIPTADPVAGGLPPISGIALAPPLVIGPFAVPEPTSACLVLLLASAGLVDRRR